MKTVEFEYEQKIYNFRHRKGDKLKKLLNLFSKYKKKDINNYYFLKSGNILSSNEDLNKRIEELFPENGKTHLLIQEQEPGFGRTMSMLELNKKDLEDSLINDDDITRKTKLCMFIKLYFALFIKFFFISIIVGSCLIFKIIDEYLMDKKIILAINISSALIIYIISISLYFVPKEYRHYKKIYIFSLLYNLCIIINCLILSKYINYDIIFICLFLISLHFFSIGMLIFIFKNYNCYGLLVTPFITNIISIIILYFFIYKIFIKLLMY